MKEILDFSLFFFLVLLLKSGSTTQKTEDVRADVYKSEQNGISGKCETKLGRVQGIKKWNFAKGENEDRVPVFTQKSFTENDEWHVEEQKHRASVVLKREQKDDPENSIKKLIKASIASVKTILVERFTIEASTTKSQLNAQQEQEKRTAEKQRRPYVQQIVLKMLLVGRLAYERTCIQTMEKVVKKTEERKYKKSRFSLDFLRITPFYPKHL